MEAEEEAAAERDSHGSAVLSVVSRRSDHRKTVLSGEREQQEAQTAAGDEISHTHTHTRPIQGSLVGTSGISSLCGDIRQTSQLMQTDAGWTNDVAPAAVD